MLNQSIFNLLISQRVNGMAYKLLFKVRSLLLAMQPNATINYTYGSFKLQFPFSHDYPLNKKTLPDYSENLGLVSKVVKQKYSTAKAIDVGANIGDSAAILFHHSRMEILCIEGNPKFIPMLEHNCRQIPSTVIETCFVGEVHERVKPVNTGGTASLEASEEGIEVKTMSEILAKHPEFKQAKLLKIDTDGFDNKILRASETLLKESKPVLFFEFDPYFLLKQGEVPGAIFPFLKNLNYKHLLLFDNKGRFMCETSTDASALLDDFIHYFNQQGQAYLDICALHEEDSDLSPKIKEVFAQK